MNPNSKTILTLALGLLILPALGLARSPGTMIVVAEQTRQGAKHPSPKPANPTYYLAFDSGYLELGNYIAGLKPPSPVTIGQELHAALSAAGYEVATAENTPALVLIYSYGALSPEPLQGHNIGSNLRARLNLIATKDEVEQAQDQLLYGSLIPYVRPTTRDTLDFAHDPRYFITVSAFDYTDFIERKPTLLWCVRLSTLETSGDVAEIVPALAGASSPYLGRNYKDRQFGSVPSLPAEDPLRNASATPPVRFLLPHNAIDRIDPNFLRNVMLGTRANNAGLPANFAAGPAAPLPTPTSPVLAH